PRDPSKEVQYVPVDGHFNFHYANGYEDEKGDIVFVNPKVVGKPGVVKLDLGAVGGGGGGGVGSSGSGINGVVETRWNPAPHQFVGEVVFAAREGAAPDAPEDDGYLLSYLWDGLLQQSFLIIFDAADITKGPISKVPIPTNVPFALHGMYVPDLLFDEKEIKQKFTAFSALDGKNWNEMKGGFSGLGISYDYGI
ncbi:retinal pigment epithelial membrane protein-domain-containing protein, partial [Ochromonadaceae sp. CCMP2298]